MGWGGWGYLVTFVFSSFSCGKHCILRYLPTYHTLPIDMGPSCSEGAFSLQSHHFSVLSHHPSVGHRAGCSKEEEGIVSGSVWCRRRRSHQSNQPIIFINMHIHPDAIAMNATKPRPRSVECSPRVGGRCRFLRCHPALSGWQRGRLHGGLSVWFPVCCCGEAGMGASPLPAPSSEGWGIAAQPALGT